VDGAHLGETLIAIQTAFVEMPELTLTLGQAQRLWALPQDVCEAALNALIERRFLVRTPERVYLRRSWWSFRGETDPAALTT
jgi:hypothetical protein